MALPAFEEPGLTCVNGCLCGQLKNKLLIPTVCILCYIIAHRMHSNAVFTLLMVCRWLATWLATRRCYVSPMCLKCRQLIVLAPNITSTDSPLTHTLSYLPVSSTVAFNSCLPSRLTTIFSRNGLERHSVTCVPPPQIGDLAFLEAYARIAFLQLGKQSALVTVV